MPTRKSAKKTIRQDAVRRIRNRSDKSALRTQIKKFVSATKNHDFDEAGKHLSLAAKKLDKIAAKNIIHKKTASRKKSRLAKFLNKHKAAV
ncbi:30S ribosomal protein S20 [Candidatus Scalindua japonica]|uniref:Small ribosomal subunit protein bS20 n=1 Tax=Candidatus Scalindua japonica TaxID=1284222 RepID=A0A286U3M5_9BACT|nr:30S ribosomal protein S20 [Candidatus Scalindua japonica]GAX62725.1 30S ribosomal protein S20 [Candidatus Scalindua japonica]